MGALVAFPVGAILAEREELPPARLEELAEVCWLFWLPYTIVPIFSDAIEKTDDSAPIAREVYV